MLLSIPVTKLGVDSKPKTKLLKIITKLLIITYVSASSATGSPAIHFIDLYHFFM